MHTFVRGMKNIFGTNEHKRPQIYAIVKAHVEVKVAWVGGRWATGKARVGFLKLPHPSIDWLDIKYHLIG